MSLRIQAGDIVHHPQKRYGLVVDQAPKGMYWDTQRFWKVRWLDLGVIDSLKEDGYFAKHIEEVPERDVRLCNMNLERRILIGALQALSRRNWQSSHDEPCPDYQTAWTREDQP